MLGLAWALSLRRSVLPQETTRLVSGRRRRQVQGGLGGQGQSRPGLASPAFACLGLRPVTLWPPKPSRRPCGEAWGRGPWPQLPGLGSAGCRGHWSSDPRRRQGGPAGGACRSHSPPALDPGPWPQGPPEARSFSAGVGCCSPCVLSSVAPHGSEDPRGRCLPGPGRPGGGGGSRPLPASAPSLRLPLGLRAQPSPGTSSKALGGLAPRSPCQQPRERREPGPPWPQPAPGSLILLGAPRLPPGRSFSRAWGAPRRGAAVMAWPARGTVLGVQRRTERAASSRLRARPDPPSRPRVGGRGPGPLGWRCGSLLCSGPRLSRPRQPPGPPPTPHAGRFPPQTATGPAPHPPCREVPPQPHPTAPHPAPPPLLHPTPPPTPPPAPLTPPPTPTPPPHHPPPPRPRGSGRQPLANAPAAQPPFSSLAPPRGARPRALQEPAVG